MSRGIISALCLSLAGLQAGFADTAIRVGGVEVTIPDPGGFALLTPDMSPYYEVRQSSVTPDNVLYAAFVPDEITESLLAGEIPEFYRHLSIETARAVARLSLSPSDFAEVKDVIRNENEAMLAAAFEELPETLGAIEEDLSDALDVDMALSVTPAVPLPAHAETDRSISYSMLSKVAVEAQGGVNETMVVAATINLVYVRGKALFVYAFGAEEDLEWTRDFSAQWIAEIIATNPARAR